MINYEALDEALEYLGESSTLHKATFGFKIHPHQDYIETLKKHEYPGLLNFVKKLKDVDDLEYMRRDASSMKNLNSKIREAIEKNDASNKYVKAGITLKDCDLTEKWFKEVLMKAISDRIREIRNK